MAGARFDELIHSPIRLSIVSILAPADGVEFRLIRDELGLSDSVLSKHVSALQAAGYVDVRKASMGRGMRRTWLDLTPTGLAAFDGHVAALQEIVDRARRPVGEEAS